jgi:hypothetical protein
MSFGLLFSKSIHGLEDSASPRGRRRTVVFSIFVGVRAGRSRWQGEEIVVGNGEGGENIDHPAQEEGDGERKPYVAHLPSESAKG